MRLAALTVVAALLVAIAVAVWPNFVAWTLKQQTAFHRELTTAFEALTSSGGVPAATALIAASFLYGLFHAAGPGHGKAVLAGYLMTRPELIGRSVGIAAAAAACQGTVALALVYGLIFLAGWLPRDTQTAVLWSERASFLLVMGLGLAFLLRAGRGGLAWLRRPSRACKSHGHAHRHAHGADCGHAHLPEPDALTQADGWRTRFGLVLSMGLRPCSGAILVLVFAQLSGLVWAGLASVFAMSAGTAVATGSLAVLAVTLRHQALRWSGAGTASATAGVVLTAAGGLFLLAIGASLFGATFAGRHPLAM